MNMIFVKRIKRKNVCRRNTKKQIKEYRKGIEKERKR
jgi:hypothetical protein